MYNELLRVTIIVGLSNSTVISSSAGSYEKKKKKKKKERFIRKNYFWKLE